MVKAAGRWKGSSLKVYKVPFLVKTKLGKVVLNVIHRINFAQVKFQRMGLSLVHYWIENIVKVTSLNMFNV